MIVRKIKPGEVKRTNELFSIAFEIPYQEPSGAPSRENAYQLEKYAAFEDDNETMTSCLSAVPFQMNFDGSVFQMTGIGGVSSLPHCRRNGGIRGCFQMMLPELYAKGVTFSYLYPFSTSYYRKFGYEQAGMCWLYEWDLSQIPFSDKQGTSVLVDQSNAKKLLPDIKKLYQQWQDEYNGMTLQEVWDYEFVTRADPYTKQEFTYLYRNHNGEAAGYMTFHKEVTAHGQKLVCSRFVFRGMDGFKGLLMLAKAFASDHLSISFRVPESLRIEPLIKEWSLGAVKRTPVVLGMIRVIRVEQVLKKARYRGDGFIALRIHDAWIPENDAIFHVEFRNGKAVKVQKIHHLYAEVDATMDIHLFSQLIYGCLDACALDFCEDVCLGSSPDVRERLQKVFYHKPYYIMDYF